MKNRTSTMAALLSLLLCPLLSWAQGSAANSGKVGIINIQEAIASTGEGKKAFAEIQKKYQPRQQELQRQQQEIQALQEQLQRQATTLSDEEQRRLARELEDKQKLFKRSTEDANADFQSDRDEAIRRIGQKMIRVIDDFSRQNGYSLVIDGAQIPVYFVAPENVITEEIVRRYDTANPVDSASTPAANPPATRPAAAPAAPKPAAPAKPADKPKP